ncbi:MAG TPA: dUTP diphosphatase [Eggerthellaceae bacterium]|nr:dUTP diphosphatase [Eggerthellaceae bacterium]
MNEISVPVKRLDKTLDMPGYAYPGDAGLDLRAAESAVLAPFERRAISCGIALAIPRGYAGFVLPRSGLAAKHGISIVNAPGLIDSDYRGELKAILVNLDAHEPFEIAHGDRIAQLVIAAYERVDWEETDTLDETERGAGGFGHTGV